MYHLYVCVHIYIYIYADVTPRKMNENGPSIRVVCCSIRGHGEIGSVVDGQCCFFNVWKLSAHREVNSDQTMISL